MQDQRSTWRGGPRPLTSGASRHTRAKDDLEVYDNQDGFIDSSMLAALAQPITQPNTPDRTSRRWALDIETEQRWQHFMERSRRSIQHLDQSPVTPATGSPSAPTPISPTTADSRWQFYGPRPRGIPRASPLSPHTPFTPFSPYTPDTPELETPDDEIAGSHTASGAPRKFESNLSDVDHYPSLHRGREFMITPFLLREPSANTNNTTELSLPNNIGTEIGGADLPQHIYQPVATPVSPGGAGSRGGVQAVVLEDSTTTVTPVVTTPITPSSSSQKRQSQHSSAGDSKRSSRPRLSIITSSSWPRSSTSSRDNQLPKGPLPASLILPKDSSAVLAQLTELLAADVLQDQQKYRDLLAYRGDDAQLILDCLQVVLDYPFLRNADRATILKALTRLSTRSGLYPRCFQLQGIEQLGMEAVDEGRYGDVWKALSHEQVVCLKLLRTYQRMPTEPLLKKLSHEALLWGQLSHPNILPFYGIHINEVKRNRFGLVSPWMENGNIVNYLKHNPDVPRIPLIHDIASGLQYLHTLDIVHGDIKGTNILVTSNGRACLADFGLSTLLGDNILVWPSLGSEPTRSGGTIRWRAPELFFEDSIGAESPPTTSSDVYSFACAAYEVITGLIPFHEIKGEHAMMKAKLVDPDRDTLKPRRPSSEEAREELTDEMWNLLEDCWSYEPSERPALDEVLRRLERLMNPGVDAAAANASASASAGGGGPRNSERFSLGPGASRRDAVLSSSLFRTSSNKRSRPSEADLLKVMTMIST